MDINLLVKLTARAWSLEIMALMHEGIPGRQASLLAQTGAGRTAFLQSLNYLLDIGYISRNKGHGHPLRPEYKIAPKGYSAAEFAYLIKNAIPPTSRKILYRYNWPLPVLAVCHRPRYFIDIKRDLASVTDRALSQSLIRLQENNLLIREVESTTRPPRPLYQAVNLGLEISKAINSGSVAQ